MAIIEKQIELEGTKGKEQKIVLFDSGSTYSCIRPELANKLEIVVPLPQPFTFETAAEAGRTVTANEAVRLNFYVKGYRFSDEFMLIPNLSEEVIIGTLTMQKWRMKLDFEHEDVIIDPHVTRLRLI